MDYIEKKSQSVKKSQNALISKSVKPLGSVKFFKHIIALFLFLLIVSLVAVCITEKIENSHLQDKVLQLQSDLEMMNKRFSSTAEEASTEEPAAIPTEAPAASPTVEPNPTIKPSAAIPTAKPTSIAASFAYQTMYPDLYCDPQTPVASPDKTLYLTFDDGPSENTARVLAILRKYGIKATFFVVGGSSARNIELMKQAIAEGHSIGVHTYSHSYAIVYASVESYLTDFKKEYDLIYSDTGVKPSIFRFPGGSVNSYNHNIYKQIIAEMKRRGFTYYDWNVSSGDGSAATKAEAFKNNILSGVSKVRSGIVLMHDSFSKTETIGVLEDVIVELISRGYKFAPINNKVMPVTFSFLK